MSIKLCSHTTPVWEHCHFCPGDVVCNYQKDKKSSTSHFKNVWERYDHDLSLIIIPVQGKQPRPVSLFHSLLLGGGEEPHHLHRLLEPLKVVTQVFFIFDLEVLLQIKRKGWREERINSRNAAKWAHKQVGSRDEWEGGWEGWRRKGATGNKGNFINMQHNVCAGSWEDLQKQRGPHLLLMSPGIAGNISRKKTVRQTVLYLLEVGELFGWQQLELLPVLLGSPQ